MIERAYGQLKEGDCEDAAQAFSDCLLLEPVDARAYYGRGMAYFQLKKWGEAIFDFKKATELNPEDPESRVSLGMSQALGNKAYDAIETFETLLSKHPKYVRGHIQLAQLYYKLGVIAKGHRQMDTALASKPSPDERIQINAIKKEQLTLDKKRHYRPDFEELRRHNRATSGGFLKKLKSLFGL